MYITSLQNEKIKALRALKSKKGREESGTYLLEGKRAVFDAVGNGVPFLCIIVQDNLSEQYAELIRASGCRELLQVSPQIIEALSETSSPEGIMAQARAENRGEPDFESLGSLVILLDRLQDPGNLGTVIRTADAAGAGAVLVSRESVELYNGKTVRATMGSIFNIPVFTEQVLEEAIPRLQQAGYTVCSTGMDGQDVYSIAFKKEEKLALLIGNEGNGVSPALAALCDRVLALPMRGKAESLNAAMAAGIFMYQITFNRKGS